MISQYQFHNLEIKYYIGVCVNFIVLNRMPKPPTTMVCVSLAARDADGMVKAADAARRAGADIVEVRLDRLSSCTTPDISRFKSISSPP